MLTTKRTGLDPKGILPWAILAELTTHEKRKILAFRPAAVIHKQFDFPGQRRHLRPMHKPVVYNCSAELRLRLAHVPLPLQFDPLKISSSRIGR